MRSHPLPNFDVDAVYETVRDNTLYFIHTLLQSWGDCIDKVLYDIAKKRTRIAKVASFFSQCDADYIARSIYILDKYIPTSTKKRFLDAMFTKYTTIVRPWIIQELKKKRPKKKKNPQQKKNQQHVKEHLLLAMSFLVDAVSALLRYHDSCIADEVHYILSQSKRMELLLLKRIQSKHVYRVLSTRVPLLSTVAQHTTAVNNIRHATCRSDDRHIKQFALDVLNKVVNDPIQLQRLLITRISRI